MDDSQLIAMATQARERAYAPYSGFRVGAVVLTADGSVFCGCNIENASYGLTICAERVAIFAAVSSGRTDILALAVVADAEPPVAPCGACRQVLAEFAAEARVVAANPGGAVRSWALRELLPEAPFAGGERPS